MAKVASFDSMDPRVREDPYAFYRALREQAPVYEDPASQSFLVSRYDEVFQVIHDPQLFSSAVGPAVALPPPAALEIFARTTPPVPTLLTADPPVLEDLFVQLHTDQPVARVWWATPDGANPAGQALEFSTERDRGRTRTRFRVPWLAYWDLIVLEFADGYREVA